MISTTVLAGELGDIMTLRTGELYRYVHLEAVAELYAERPYGMIFKVPVHAFGNLKTAFYALPKGTRVILRGWIETRDEIGVVVMSELEELFPLPKEKKSSLSSKAQKELQMLS